MIGHLLVDFAKRLRALVFWLGLLLLGCAIQIMIDPHLSDRDIVAFSLGGAMFVGWFLAGVSLAPREVQLRPISRREIWLARCVVAVLFCAIPALLLAVTLPFKNGGPKDWATVAVTVLVINVLFMGAFIGIVALFPPNFWAPGSVGPAKAVLAVAYFMSPFWPAVLPFLWHVRPEDFTVSTWLFAIMALGLIAIAARHVPEPGTMRPRGIVRSTGGGWAGQRLEESAQLHGLPLMLATEARQALLFAVSMIIAISALNRLLGGSWIVAAASSMLAPFAGATVVGDRSIGFLWMLFGPPGIEGSRYSLRQLRVLPVSSVLLASTLVGIRWLHTTAAWLAILTLVGLAPGAWPAHLRLDLFSTALGLAAVGATGSLAVGKTGWRGQIPTMLCAVATAVTIVKCVGPVSPGASVVLWSMGPVLGGLSIVGCRILLTRRAALYQRPAPNWSAGVPQA